MDEPPLLDTLGLLCPLPIIKTATRVKDLAIGAELIVLSDDAGILEDMPAWCRSNGQELLSIDQAGKIYRLRLRRRK
ncbi:MAG: sulfurtransferase TusA family protein [Acidobacteria bacterium]|nr:sulfurtransferase TusA family protein [Acidobacteriota bacterium]